MPEGTRPIADRILIGGGMAFTFVKASGGGVRHAGEHLPPDAPADRHNFFAGGPCGGVPEQQREADRLVQGQAAHPFGPAQGDLQCHGAAVRVADEEHGTVLSGRERHARCG